MEYTPESRGQNMRISELAARSGLSIDTIRFYEKMGLLDPTHRTRQPNGYRDYNELAITRLELVKNGRQAGFTLAEMCESIQAWESGEISSAEKEAYLFHKIDEIDARIAHLEAVKAYLRQKIE